MEKYSIGKVAKLCNISVKTLRYYAEIDLLKPAYVNKENGYRYYTNQEIHKITLIKYYKELGFKLENIKELIMHYELNTLDRYFDKELTRLEAEIEEAKRKYFSIKEWQNLIQQGKSLNNEQIAQRYAIKQMPIYTTVKFQYAYEGETLVDEIGFIYSNAFVEFCQQHEYYTFGPFMIRFPNVNDRINGKVKNVDCLSEVYSVQNCDEAHRQVLGNVKVLSYIHKGNYHELSMVYARMKKWAKSNNIQLQGDSYERYIIDSWSTQDANEYITEVMMPLVEE